MRYILICATILSLTACVKTIGTVLEEGGTRVTSEQITHEFSGNIYDVKSVQGGGVGKKRVFSFSADGGFTFNQIPDGKWYANEEGKLCIEWPKSMGWNKGYCFIVVEHEGKQTLFDAIVKQERFILTRR